MSEYKKAAPLSYVNILIRNSIGIFLTPFVIRTLGMSEYGLYTLIGSFIVYLTILDLGLNASVTRYAAQYISKKWQDRGRVFWG